MKKSRILILIGILVSVFCIFIGLIFFKIKADNTISTSKIKGGDITRYEWIKMLCEYAGITDSYSDTPYFKDVNTENNYFSYVQSAVEWKILQKTNKFNGEAYVSGEFIAVTAVRSLGNEKLQIYFETDNEIKDEDCIKLAIDNGLIREEELKQGISRKRCKDVLNDLENLYWNEISAKKYSEIVYQQGVVTISMTDIEECNKDFSKIKVSPEMVAQLKKGTVVILEKENSGLKYAREISNIEQDGTIALENASLDKTIQTMTVSDISEISFEDIINNYDLYQSSNSSQYQVIPLVSNHNKYQEKPMLDKKVQYTSEGFTLALSTEDNKLSVTIINNATKEECELPMEIELEEGNDWSATINMDKLVVAAQIKYSATTGVQYVDVGVDSHSTIVGKATIFSKDKKIKIMTYPIPMAGGLINVDVNLYLVFSAEGNISLEAEVPFQTSVQYVKGIGLRNITNNLQVEPREVKVDCEVKAFFRDEVALSILQCINVMDVQGDIGLDASVEAIIRPNDQVCMNEAIHAPIIKMSVCKGDEETLLGKIGVSKEWEFIDSEDAPFKLQRHLEIMPDGTSQFVEACTYREEDAQPIDSITYETQYAIVNNISCPTFCFDYPSNWTVTKEEMDMDLCNETVEISNKRGVNITYKDFSINDLGSVGANGHSYLEAEITRIADSGFISYYANGMNQNDSDINYMVAKVKVTKEMMAGVDADWKKVDGVTYYAVVPDNISKTITMNGYLGLYEELSFTLLTPHVFIASAPDGEFTKEEEKEVIAILSSLRTKTDIIQTNDPIYDALSKGDYSYFCSFSEYLSKKVQKNEIKKDTPGYDGKPRKYWGYGGFVKRKISSH